MGAPAIYPWRTMKVGDEFRMQTKKLSSARNMASIKGIDLARMFQVKKTTRGIICRRIR